MDANPAPDPGAGRTDPAGAGASAGVQRQSGSRALVPKVDTALAELEDDIPDLPVKAAIKQTLGRKPAGKPRGYMPLAKAIAFLRSLPYEDVKILSTGEPPLDWPEEKLTWQWVMLAKSEMSGRALADHDERVEGKVAAGEVENFKAGVTVNVGPVR